MQNLILLFLCVIFAVFSQIDGIPVGIAEQADSEGEILPANGGLGDGLLNCMLLWYIKNF